MDESNNKINSSELLESMDLEELKDMRKKLDRAIASYETRKRQQALSAVEQAAREHGFKLADLIAEGRSGRSKRSGDAASAVAYANPDNPEQTWSGRGRRPQWIKDALEAGRRLEDLAA